MSHQIGASDYTRQPEAPHCAVLLIPLGLASIALMIAGAILYWKSPGGTYTTIFLASVGLFLTLAGLVGWSLYAHARSDVKNLRAELVEAQRAAANWKKAFEQF